MNKHRDRPIHDYPRGRKFERRPPGCTVWEPCTQQDVRQAGGALGLAAARAGNEMQSAGGFRYRKKKAESLSAEGEYCADA